MSRQPTRQSSAILVALALCYALQMTGFVMIAPLFRGKEKDMKTRSVGSNKKVLAYHLSEPLSGAAAAKVDIETANGNLTIDKLSNREQMLASGTLEYVENQDPPACSVKTSDGQATLTLKSTSIGRPWFRFPWSTCNAAIEWQIHLNPTVSSDITAHSGGGNVKLDLSGMTVAYVSAETGGGNMDMILPDNVANLSVSARTGGGNVTVELGSGTTGRNIVNAKSGAGTVVVRIPSSVAARIHATTGWGKVSIDPRFIKTDEHTYQSPDFDYAIHMIELTASSGAGNVSINTK